MAKLQQFYRLQPQSHISGFQSSFTRYSTSEGLVSLYPILHMFLHSLGRLWPILQEELADLAFEVWKHCFRHWLLKERRHGACHKGISVLIDLFNISRKQIILITWLISLGSSLKQMHTDKSREVNSVNCVCILYLLSSEYCSGYL